MLFFIANDHITSFFFDHYSHFALGVGDKYWVADEGGGPRKLPAIKGHPALAQHVANGLVADEFDMSYFQGKGLDHGFFSPLSLLLPHDKGSGPPRWCRCRSACSSSRSRRAKRCFKLGQSLRTCDRELSGRHQGRHRRHRRPLAPGARRALRLQQHAVGHGVPRSPREGSGRPHEHHHRGVRGEGRLRRLRSDHVADHARRAVEEGEEAAPDVLPAVDDADRRGDLRERLGRSEAESDADYRTRINKQWDGIEKLTGTYPFTLDRSVKGYRINYFLHELIKPEFRKQFLADPEPLFQQYELTEQERDMIRRRDWRALIQYGVIFFLLEKLGAVVGTTNLHIYAAMRGQSLEDFQKTRNAQVLYSVAGQDAGKKDWDKSSEHASLTRTLTGAGARTVAFARAGALRFDAATRSAATFPATLDSSRPSSTIAGPAHSGA